MTPAQENLETIRDHERAGRLRDAVSKETRNIYIDDKRYEVPRETTGLALRELAAIPPDFDLWLAQHVVDVYINPAAPIHLRADLCFYSQPHYIGAG